MEGLPDGKVPRLIAQHFEYWVAPVSAMPQLFELVLAMKLVINCSNSLLPQDGQVAMLLSCSFNVKANKHSFPHFRHL